MIYLVILIFLVATFIFEWKIHKKSFYLSNFQKLRSCLKLREKARRKHLIDYLWENGDVTLLQSSSIKIPEYKFYTDLILNFKKMCTEFGHYDTAFIPKLKKRLHADDRFGMQIEKVLTGQVIQMLFIALIVWGMIYYSSILIGSSPKPLILKIILSMHILGLALSILWAKSLKQKIFRHISSGLRCFMRLEAFCNMSLPLNQAIERSGLVELEEVKNRHIQVILKRFQLLIKRVTVRGEPIFEGLETIIDELWFITDIEMQQFIKKAQAIKLLMVTCFYFGSYLLFLFDLFGRSMNLYF